MMTNGTETSRKRWSVPVMSQRCSLLIACRKYLDNILTRAGPFSDEDWVPGQETINGLESSKVLLVWQKPA